MVQSFHLAFSFSLPHWNGLWQHHVLYFQQSCWAPGPSTRSIAVGQWQVASPTSLTPSRGSNQGLCGARHPDTTVTVKSGVELTWQRGDTSACGTGAVRQPRGQRSQDSKPLIKEMGLTWREVEATYRWEPLSLWLILVEISNKEFTCCGNHQYASWEAFMYGVKKEKNSFLVKWRQSKSSISFLKGIAHPKMKIPSFFTLICIFGDCVISKY